MNTLKSSLLSFMAIAVILFACDKNPTSPEEPSELTDTEKMLIVAAEVTEVNGGVMTDLEMAKGAALGQPGSLMKTTDFDTTFTHAWITYSLHLSYYSADGNEQPRFVQNRTDKVVYEGSLSGNKTGEGTYQEVVLKSNSLLEITNIISNTVASNGTSWNNSEYKFSYNDIKLSVKSNSTLSLKDIIIDLNSDSYIPLSGKIEAKLKGKFTKEGVIKDTDVDYEFICTVEFTGSSKAKVTLPNGSQFTLDLVTGSFSKL